MAVHYMLRAIQIGLLLCAFSVAGCWGQTAGEVYYVSAIGNDENPGTMEQPWRTILKAINRMNPGDTTLVRGGTYDKFVPIGFSAGSGYDGAAARNGTATAPITLKAYPGETVTWTNDLQFPVDHWSMGRMKFIDIRERSYWIIEGFNFSHTQSPQNSLWWYYGIYVEGTKVKPAAGITIRGNTFEGNQIIRPGGTVIDLRYTDDAIIENNTFRMWSNTTVDSSGVGGVVLETEWRDDELTAVPNRNAIIRNNTFEGIGGDGVQIGPWAGYNTLIESNVFKTRYNEFSNYTFENAVDVKRSWFTTIRGNTMWGYRKKTTKDPYGAAILVHLMAEDVLIDRNTIYDNNTGIAAAKGNPDLALPTPAWYDGSKELFRITITRNVIFNTNTEGQAGGGSGPGIGIAANGINGLQIYHNVIAFSGETAVKLSDNTGAAIKNNIIYQAINGILDESHGNTDLAELTVGPNLHQSVQVPLMYRMPNGSLAALGQTRVRWTTPNIFVRVDNARFVNPTKDPATANYQLTPGSPAIDAGETLPGYNDDFLGDAPDLGAFEYNFEEQLEYRSRDSAGGYRERR